MVSNTTDFFFFFYCFYEIMEKTVRVFLYFVVNPLEYGQNEIIFKNQLTVC